MNWKNGSMEDPIQDGLIATAITAGIFFVLKNAANVKPSKACLNAMDIINLAGRICGGVLVEDYAVYNVHSCTEIRGRIEISKFWERSISGGVL